MSVFKKLCLWNRDTTLAREKVNIVFRKMYLRDKVHVTVNDLDGGSISTQIISSGNVIDVTDIPQLTNVSILVYITTVFHNTTGDKFTKPGIVVTSR